MIVSNSLARKIQKTAKAMYEIVLGDNLEYLGTQASDTFKLVVTSPPYNIGKEYEDKVSLEYWLDGQRKVIAECARVLRLTGSICWQVGNYVKPDGEIVPLDIPLYEIFKEHGFKLRNRMVWEFGHGLHCRKRFSGRYETILWFTKTDKYTFNLDPVRVPQKYPNKKYFKGPKAGQLSCNPLGKNPGDVWHIPNVKNNHPEKTDHPCQFPVELVERLVLSLTDPDDKVLDPYMGVGSSVVAAVKNGRHGVGCDITESYVNIALERIKLLEQGKLKLRPMNRPIYSE